MLRFWLQICHCGHPAQRPSIACQDKKKTCPLQLPWEVMAHRVGMKKSDRKRTGGIGKKSRRGRAEWARGMKRIYSKVKRQDSAIALRKGWGGKKTKWAMQCRVKARVVEVEWCARPEQTKQSQEPRGAGCLSAIQPVSYSVTYSVEAIALAREYRSSLFGSGGLSFLSTVNCLLQARLYWP